MNRVLLPAPRPNTRKGLPVYSASSIYGNMNIEKARFQTSTEIASNFLKILAHPYRLMLICQLLDSSKSVGELAELMDVRQPTVSKHLALLREAGLVRATRDAQSVHYELASDPAREILTVLYRHFCAAPRSRGSDCTLKARLTRTRSR